MWENMCFGFTKKIQVIVSVKKDRLSVVSPIVEMVAFVGKKFHGNIN